MNPFSYSEASVNADLRRRKPSVIAQLILILSVMALTSFAFATYGAYCEHRGWTAGFKVAKAVYAGG